MNKLMTMAAIFLFTLVASNTVWSANKRIAVVVFDGVLTSDVTSPI